MSCARGVVPQKDARLNTETPGGFDRSAVDSRVRIYHLQEQAERADASDEHRQKAADRLTICQTQRRSVAGARRTVDRHRGRLEADQVYRQFKMYNDPTMNPYLYGAKQRVA